MLWSKFFVIVLLTLFCAVFSEDAFLNETIHVRVKRAKYYHYPQRFYRRPPMTYPTKGAFSYTPPPGYMMDDEEPPYPGKPKVSRRPNEGLRDDDIRYPSNIVKYLSKQDLDKIIEVAGEKERIKDNSVERRPYKRDETRVIKTNVPDYTEFSQNVPFQIQDSEQKINLNRPFVSQEESSFPQNFPSQDNVYNGPYRYQNKPPLKPEESNYHTYSGSFAPNEDLLNYVEDAIQSKTVYVNHDKYSNTPLQTEESMQNKHISYLNSYIQHEINEPHNVPAHIFSDNGEEVLPRPVNLREDDFDVSYTNNVPTVVKAPNYDVENFGDLPLMSNAHKLDTVSSYRVPHYTVTSNSKYGPSSQSSSSSSSSSSVPIEPAPPISEAKEQSDAHLKAIKIWTHRSKGTAYTLHKDGTLSLERPRPKTKYGP